MVQGVEGRRLWLVRKVRFMAE